MPVESIVGNFPAPPSAPETQGSPEPTYTLGQVIATLRDQFFGMPGGQAYASPDRGHGGAMQGAMANVMASAAPEGAAPPSVVTGAQAYPGGQPRPSIPAPLHSVAPSSAVPLERDVSIVDMSDDQIRAKMVALGGNPARPYQFSGNRAARRELRRQFEAAVAGRMFRTTRGY